MSELAVLLAGLGGIVLINGISFRLATPMWRRWATKYKDGGLTRNQRRGAAFNIPLGIGLLLSAGASTLNGSVVGLTIWYAVAMCGVLTVALWVYSPAWALPKWMRSAGVEVISGNQRGWRGDRAVWALAAAVIVATTVLLVLVDRQHLLRVVSLSLVGFGSTAAAVTRARHR